jgi:hypothetical protein
MIRKEQQDVEESNKEEVASDNGLQEKLPCMECAGNTDRECENK